MAETTQKIIIDIKAETTKATNDIKKLNRQIDGLNKTVNKSNKSMKASTGAVQKMGASFKTLSQHLARLVVIYGSFQAVSSTIKVFASFEQAIATLGAISGATGEQLKSLEAKALELGESTVFSASQVADAMVEMARAGLTYEQTLDGIAGVLDLAVVGNLSLSQAVIATTGAMHGFNLEAKDMGIISDIMAKASSDSAQTVEQLSQSMAKVSPVATKFNNSITETTGLLEVLADNNIKGALSGTQLKISMLRLSANVEVKKYLQDLSDATGGLSTEMYDATGKAKPFHEQLKVLKDATKDLSEEARNTHLARIFGSEAVTSALLLMDNLDAVEKKVMTLENAFGFSGEASRQMMDTLQGSYKELLSALEGLQIKIGQNLSPALKQIIDDLTEFTRGIDEADIEAFTDGIASLIDGAKELDKWLSALATTLVGWSDGLSDNAKEVIVFTAVVYKLRKSLLALFTMIQAHPVIAGLTAVLALVTIATVAWQKAIDDLNASTEEFLDAHTKMAEVIEEVWTKDGKFTDSELRKYLSDIDAGTAKAIISLSNMQTELDELYKQKSDPFSFFSDEEADRVRTLENNIKTLEATLVTLGHTQTKLDGITKDFIKTRLKEIDAINKTKDAQDQLSKSAKPLLEEELKAVTKLTEKYEARAVALEKTLGTMKSKEARFAKDILKLEDDIAKVRADYANKRKSATLNLANDIADINARGLTDIQTYNDAQIRADEQLALAKKALAEGNLVIAQEYFDKYNSLIEVNASAEIKEGETVVKSLKSLNKELIDDKKAGHDFNLQLLKESEAREIAVINNKIALKQAEMDMVILQIDLQIKAIELMGTMIDGIKGVGWDEQLAKFKQDAIGIQTNLDAIFKEQRELKIKPTSTSQDASTVASQIQGDIQRDIDGKPIEPKIGADTTQAEAEFDVYKNKVTGEEFVVEMGADIEPALLEAQGFKKVAEQTRVEATMDLDTSPAEASANSARATIENTPVVADEDLNIQPALASDSRMRIIASRPLPKIVQIIEHHHVQTGNYSTGGVIPRFAVGGSLDNGIGHSDKSGALGGYGGGDKIKALLEAGEFIVRKEAVKALGLDRLYAINQGRLPRFNQGGAVAPKIPRYATGGAVKSSDSNRVVDVNLNIGNQSFAVQADEVVANALADYLQRIEF